MFQELGDCDMGTPVVNMFKKMKKGTKGDSVNIPKHSKKVISLFQIIYALNLEKF